MNMQLARMKKKSLAAIGALKSRLPRSFARESEREKESFTFYMASIKPIEFWVPPSRINNTRMLKKNYVLASTETNEPSALPALLYTRQKCEQ